VFKLTGPIETDSRSGHDHASQKSSRNRWADAPVSECHERRSEGPLGTVRTASTRQNRDGCFGIVDDKSPLQCTAINRYEYEAENEKVLRERTSNPNGNYVYYDSTLTEHPAFRRAKVSRTSSDLTAHLKDVSSPVLRFCSGYHERFRTRYSVGARTTGNLVTGVIACLQQSPRHFL
jgi:hypothetical protein